MKHFRLHVAVFFTALAALIATVAFDTRTSRGQSQDGVKSADAAKPLLKPTASIRPVKAPTETSSAFASAATRNALLLNELNWTFGGKQQRGWYLYTPLISRLLNTDQNAASDAFASALSWWQQRSGLNPSGVLDEDSLYGMVSEWQGRRLKEFAYARPDQLLTAPVSDFYDPSRPEELRQVERETYAAYKRMVAAAAADPSLGLALGMDGALAPTEKYLKIVSAFRSREYQDRLRQQSPDSGRAGLAINSPHFSGRALDLYVGGEPVETKDTNRSIQVQTRVYQWLVRNADRFGFRPYYYEPWHWEYVPEIAPK